MVEETQTGQFCDSPARPSVGYIPLDCVCIFDVDCRLKGVDRQICAHIRHTLEYVNVFFVSQEFSLRLFH